MWRRYGMTVGPLVCGGYLYMYSNLTGTIAGNKEEEEERSQGLTKDHKMKTAFMSRGQVRLRRADTNLTTFDNVIQGYEYRLRETASLEKVFKYFSSVVVGGEEMMTPLDMVRAITPGVPPSPSSTPLNVPIFEETEMTYEFTKFEMPDFFKFGEDDNGLISYERFIIILTLLSLPSSEIPVAYNMCAGEDFKNKIYRSPGLNVNNFDFIMKRNIAHQIRGQDYTTDHENEAIIHHLFGKDLNKHLTLEEFRAFHRRLRDEVESLKFYLLSDKLDVNGNPVMSLPAFARSVAALTPSDHRANFLKRAKELENKPLSKIVVDQEKRRNNIPENKENVVARELTVSFEEYVAWQEVLRSLIQMEEAVMMYSYQDGRFTATNINRAASAVAGVKLSKAQVFAIFHLFDIQGKSYLQHDEFVRLLSRMAMSRKMVKYETEGLGLYSLFICLRHSCKDCIRDWYEGTLPMD